MLLSITCWTNYCFTSFIMATVWFSIILTGYDRGYICTCHAYSINKCYSFSWSLTLFVISWLPSSISPETNSHDTHVIFMRYLAYYIPQQYLVTVFQVEFGMIASDIIILASFYCLVIRHFISSIFGTHQSLCLYVFWSHLCVSALILHWFFILLIFQSLLVFWI